MKKMLSQNTNQARAAQLMQKGDEIENPEGTISVAALEKTLQTISATAKPQTPLKPSKELNKFLNTQAQQADISDPSTQTISTGTSPMSRRVTTGSSTDVLPSGSAPDTGVNSKVKKVVIFIDLDHFIADQNRNNAEQVPDELTKLPDELTKLVAFINNLEEKQNTNIAIGSSRNEAFITQWLSRVRITKENIKKIPNVGQNFKIIDALKKTAVIVPEDDYKIILLSTQMNTQAIQTEKCICVQPASSANKYSEQDFNNVTGLATAYGPAPLLLSQKSPINKPINSPNSSPQTANNPTTQDMLSQQNASQKPGNKP